MDALAVKARKNRGRGSTVKAFIVEANPDLHSPLLPFVGGANFPYKLSSQESQ
jgi:hypothetical protein